MSENNKSYKYCIVPKCGSSTFKTPNKLFFPVPRHEKIRQTWCLVMKRERSDQKSLSSTSCLHCCEDHFNIKEDMISYVKHRLTGTCVRLKNGVIPHRFDCQKDINEDNYNKNNVKRRKIDCSIKNSTKNIQHATAIEKGGFFHRGKSYLASASNGHENLLTIDLTSDIEFENYQITEADMKKKTRDDTSPVKMYLETSLLEPKIEMTEAEIQKETTNNISEEKGILESTLVQSDIEITEADIKKEMTDNISTIEDYFEKPLFQPNVEIIVTRLSDDHGSITDSDSSEQLTKDLKIDKKKKSEEMLLNISRNSKLTLGLPEQAYFVIKLLSETIKTSYVNIVITLKKIRLNQPFSLLSLDFGLSKAGVSKIVKNTMPSIASCMRKFIIFPLNRQSKLNPLSYQSKDYNVLCVIDSLEVRIEKPSNPTYNTLTKSRKTNCNAIKYLISLTPDGVINYISDGYGSVTTDSRIFEDCDFISKLFPGDVVLAHRGYEEASNLFTKKGCTLLGPFGQSDVNPRNKEALNESKKVETFSVQVIDTMKRLQEFGFLLPNSFVDSQLVSYSDYMVIIACGIVNMQSMAYPDIE